MVKVSVVMPLYNQEKYIAECLASVVGQTLREIEIIVVNDGSTDRSAEIVRAFAERDERIVLVEQKNSGYGRAMNAGMERARGKYVGIVETDDYVLPEMFEALYTEAERLGADFVKSDFYRFSSEEGYVSRRLVKLSADPRDYGRILRPLDEKRVFSFPMNTWTGIYCRSFLEEFGICHNETPGASYQDNGFWFQTFCFARKAAFLNGAYYMNRRDNPNSSVYDAGKVYAACREYAHIDELLRKHPRLRNEAAPCFWLKKYHNYVFTLQRIAYKYRREFATRMREEFFGGGGPDISLINGREREDLSVLAKDSQMFLRRLGLAAEEKPFLSVVIVRTGGAFLRTFAAVANQTCGNIQILAAGDGFTDEEREFLRGDERAELCERSGASPEQALAEALPLVRGRYVHILPAGAVPSSGLYAAVLKKLSLQPADGVLCRALAETAGGAVCDLKNFRVEPNTETLRDDPYMLYRCGISCVNKIIAAAIVRQVCVRTFDENGDSPAFILRALLHCNRISVEEENNVRFPRVAGSLSNVTECLPLADEVSGTDGVGMANLIASELTCLGEGAGDAVWLSAYRSKLLAAVRPETYGREHYCSGYEYDFLIKLLYLGEAEPPVERESAAALLAAGPAAGGMGFAERSAVQAASDAAAELESVLHSVSFRAGRALTYFPRKVRDALFGMRGGFRSFVSMRADRKGLARLRWKKPLVSVVLPMYNVEKYLVECLDSLVGQTYPNIEIICVDDGSEDSTCSIVEEYASRYANVRLLRQEHGYAGTARNNGFAVAKGKYCLFLDSDDFFERDFIETMVIRAEGSGADVTVCRCRGYNQQTGAPFEMRWSVREKRLPVKTVFSAKEMKDYICTAFMGWAWDKLYRSSFLHRLKLQFQGLRSSNDAYFVFTSLALADKISFVNRVFINQRRFTLSSISQTRGKSWDNCLAAADKIYEDWNARGIFSRYERAFCNWYVNFMVWHYTTLGEEQQRALAARLTERAEAYRLFDRGHDYYYQKNDYEQFARICGKQIHKG